MAQLGPGLTPPPVVQLVDQNDVELNSGALVKSLGSISIGPGGPGSLAFKWTVDNLRQWPIFGYVQRSYTAQYPGGPIDNHYAVTVNGSTETFTQLYGSSAVTQDQGRPSTFNPTTNTYTGADGTVALFNGPALDGGVSGGYAVTNTPVTQVTYPAGQQLNYYWDTTGTNGFLGSLLAVTSSLGYQLRLTWSGTQVTSAVVFNMNSESCDPTATSCTLVGNWPKLTWDAANNRVVDNTGKWVGFTNNSGTMVITYPSGRTITIDSSGYHDGKGTSVYRYSGQYTTHVALPQYPENTTVGGPSRVVQWQNGLLTADTVYDTNSSGGLATTYQYGSGNRVSTITHPDGTQTQYGYDTRGNLNQVTQVARTPGTPPNIVSTAVFPPTCSNVKTCNKPTSITDGRGNTTDYTYDPNSGAVATVTLPAPTVGAVRPQIRYTYTQLSALYRNGSGSTVSGAPMWILTSTSQCQTQSSCAGTANEVKSSITYDPNNALLPISVSKGSGDGALTVTTATTYTANGDVATVDGPLPGAADVGRNYYDTMRRPLGTIGPAPGNGQPRRAERTSYDNDGRPATTEVGTATVQGDNDLANMTSLQQQVASYDGQGRVAAIRTTAGGTTYSLVQNSYRAAGAPDCMAVRMNPATFDSPPTDACTLGTQGSYGPDRITKYTYDGYYRTTSITNGYGTPAAETEVTTGYDSVGRVSSVTDANGNKTSYAYDGMARIYQIFYPSPTTPGSINPNDYEQLGYDPNGNLTSLKKRDNTTVTFQYDALNRMMVKTVPASATGAAGYAVYQGYDNRGLLLYARFGSTAGPGVTYGYDSLARPISETTDMDGTSRTFTSQYDASGNRKLLTSNQNYTIGFDYDGFNRLTTMHEGSATGTPILSIAYDTAGRRNWLGQGLGAATSTTSYAYDGASRLQTLTHDLAGTASDQTLGFGYNPASQIVSRTRSNSAWEYTEQVQGAKSYAVNGLNQYLTNGSATFGYDANGNLSSDGTNTYKYDAENRLVSVSGGANVTLEYDPLGRLWRYTTSNGAQEFVYDGDRLTAEYLNGVVQRTHVFGPGADEPLLTYEATSAPMRRYLHADHEGSIVAVVDENGNALAINKYGEWGVPSSSNQGRFQYTGQVWLSEIGLYYYKRRMFASRIGKFLQPDPTGYGAGMNWYTYTANDPVNNRDSTGLSNCSGGPYDGRSCQANFSDHTTFYFDGTQWGNYYYYPSTGSIVFQASGFDPSDLSQSSYTPDLAAAAASSGAFARALLNSRKTWINYNYPGLFSHVSARHFGTSYVFGSIFLPKFQNEISLLSLAVFTANSAPLRPTNVPDVYRYTAMYTNDVGQLQGSGQMTNLITLIVRDTGMVDEEGRRILQPITLYPGAALN
jgi:RHS repeat-associated protein